MEYVNNVFKQIGVEFEVRELIPDNGKDPHQKKYYEIRNDTDLIELMDVKSGSSDGIEIYFTKGQYYSDWVGATHPTMGCVITKYEYLGMDSVRNEPMWGEWGNREVISTIGHEILHSMKLDDGSGYVEDIYDKDIGKDSIISVKNIKDDYSDYYRERLGMDLIKRLLMYGELVDGKEADIPRGKIYGKDVGGVLEHKRREMRHVD